LSRCSRTSSDGLVCRRRVSARTFSTMEAKAFFAVDVAMLQGHSWAPNPLTGSW
jgi:hypothetical protein